MDAKPPREALTALFRTFYGMSVSDAEASIQFQELGVYCHDKASVLSCIPDTPGPSHRPMQLLNKLLTQLPGPWPAVPLMLCHSRLHKLLPEDVKAGHNHTHSALLQDTLRLVKASYKSFIDFLPRGPQPALRGSSPRDFITFEQLHDFVTTFYLPASATGPRPVVAVALTNGPLLAAVSVAVTAHYTSAPINPATSPKQFRADVELSGASFIVTTKSHYTKLQLGETWLHQSGIQVFCIDRHDSGSITTSTPSGDALPHHGPKQPPNQADDIALVLFTSGTSGSKKVVPLTLHSILVGVSFVIESWGLTAKDVCINMMPLYHVGGLVRNIFAPLLSGGSTVCCITFDPDLFWDVVENHGATWYYAAPSMHNLILSKSSERSSSLRKSRIRLICNAAGGLLPSLARQLRSTFDCVVLPSYGMTECMPISTPSLNYQLDREGTSGVSTGPELRILDWAQAKSPSGSVGRVCVRGGPLFSGYLRRDGSLDTSPFNADGWFDTGDLGYMDDDGFLYVTGRSKEVINRGGELISPLEVENAITSVAGTAGSPIHGRVSQALAFSILHDVLQEVVAIVLVTPPNVPRVDLKTLHLALQSTLQQVKWPVLITYMDDVPKKNNKVLRINLAQRLQLPTLSDGTSYLERHWEAVCPPAETELSTPISARMVPVDDQLVLTSIKSTVPRNLSFHYDRKSGHSQLFLAPTGDCAAEPLPDMAASLRASLSGCLHNYMVPDKIHVLPEPLPVQLCGRVDEEKLQMQLEKLLLATMTRPATSTQGQVAALFADVLAMHPSDIPKDADFFELGGDSLRAGRLLSALRRTFNVQVSVAVIFNSGSVEAIAAHIDKMQQLACPDSPEDVSEGCTETRASTQPLLMALQLVPLVVVYPMRRALQWIIFISIFSYSQGWPTNSSVVGRLLNVMACILFSRLVIRCITPWVGIAAKWLIIGRYRAGIYPMWGSYHTRWWLVQKIVSICGQGIFGVSDATRRSYCRLMGARVGENVRLDGVQLGEWDLLDIQDDVCMTRCICRPFAAERNTTMYLGSITIGRGSSVGMSTVIAAGASIPPNTHLGPNSSSWEAKDAGDKNLGLSPYTAPKPHWLLTALLTAPLSLLAWAFSMIPWAVGLLGIVLEEPFIYGTPLRDILDWFTVGKRIAYHYLAMVLGALFGPAMLFLFAVIVITFLNSVFGRPGPVVWKSCGTFPVWRASLMRIIMPTSQLHQLTAMFGKHYEATSIALRMLGSRVGKRVYWPGTGPSIGDYHLIDVGDDVVFGSRSHLVTSDGMGADKITIGGGAMVADRVCLLAGVEIGAETVMGSGSLTRRGAKYDAGGTYVGAVAGDCLCLKSNDAAQSGKRLSRKLTRKHAHVSLDGLLEHKRAPTAPMAESKETPNDGGASPAANKASPFGRAFYMKLAPYYVLGPFAIFCYSAFITAFTAFYWNVPSISALQAANVILNRFVPRGGSAWLEIAILYGILTGFIIILTTLQAMLVIVMMIAAKWILIGRRQPGNYDWDKSSYCQRWQLFLTIEKLRRDCYCSNGILGMLTSTHWLVLYFRALGARIGRDCALFANGSPSLWFTEPDLVTMGDRVVIDDASVVGHTNTRGKFDLNTINIGDRCVLRSASRMLSGSSMRDDSCLLEHTLIMSGDVVEEGWTMQGWPSSRYFGHRMHFEADVGASP